MNLKVLVDEVKKMNLHPVFLEENGEYGEYIILFQKIEHGHFFETVENKIQWNSHSITDRNNKEEKYNSISEQSFIEFLCQKTQEDNNTTICRFSLAILLDNCIRKNRYSHDDTYDKLFESIKNAVNTTIPDFNSYQLSKDLISFYRHYFIEQYSINFFDKYDIFSKWIFYFLAKNRPMGNSCLNELHDIFRNILIASDDVLLDKIPKKNPYIKFITKDYIYEYARLKCHYDDKDISFLKKILDIKSNEKNSFLENIDRIIDIEKYENYGRDDSRIHLAELFSKIDNSLIAQSFILSRTKDYGWLDYKFHPLEFAIGLLRHHITSNRSNRSKTSSFYPQKQILENREDILKFVEFLKYLEGLVLKSYSYESENFSQRAIEVGNMCLEWIECFIYYIILAFSIEIPKKIEEIISLIATDAILTRLELFSTIRNEYYYKEAGCVIDNILRNTGKKDSIDSPSLSRDLFFPYSNIMGTTWLNDFKIENILFNAVKNAERNFSNSYTDSFHEREDDLIRDLFDFLNKDFENALNIINKIDVGKSKGKWTLKWSKFRLIEEKNNGADLALIVKVDVENYIKFDKICFIQVKALAKSKNKLLAQWNIDQRQLDNLLNLSDYSFYLLLTQSFLSADQRIIPATILNSILKASGKKVTLSDSKAVLGSRSLAHFFIYEVLSGWQGTQNKELIKSIENREGIRARYVLELELGRKRQQG